MSVAGLRPLVFSDGAAGVRGEVWTAGDSSMCFPSPAALGSTWDVGLIGRLAKEVAGEARRKGVDVVLAPTVNLQRSPLAGRHFEYLSEDPLLVGRLASAYVVNLQRHGVAAAAKHFVANDAETNRFSVDVQVDEQTLRELYLAPFEELVTSAGVWVVMAAYNTVNGTTMTENRLLRTPLLEEWGFDGVVVSDWYAVRSTDASARGGLTLVMPGPEGPWGPALLDAVRAGRVPRATISDKVRRLLRLAARVGALTTQDREQVSSTQGSIAAGPAREGLVELLREAATASVVLAKNAGLLPLDPVAMRQLAILGPNAADLPIQGGGSCEVVPPYAVSVVEALKLALGTGVSVNHAVGAVIRHGLRPVPQAIATCVSCRLPGVHVRYLDAEGGEIRSEHRPDGRLIWFGHQLPAGATVEVTTRIRADVAGTWRLGVAGVGHCRLELSGQVALDEMVRPARASFANSFLDPPQRWIDRELALGEQLNVSLLHQPEHDVDFVKVVLGCRHPTVEPDSELARAVALAEAAEVALVVVGTNEEVETEGRDRTSMVLPGRQDELVSGVAEVNSQTVVVVISGAPVAMPWRNKVAAVLLAPFAGQEAGHALADVLLGVTEPSGRLATTWGGEDADVPVWSTRPVDGVMPYDENLDIGYRAWLRADRQPAFWFGHGLGYTSWTYEHLDAPAVIVADEDATVRVRIANVGRRSGKEVVQVYLSRPASSVRRPPIWLAGFALVTAGPGEVSEVAVEIVARTFQHWSVDDNGWRTESGIFRLTVGRSVGDRPLAADITVLATDHSTGADDASTA
ncbi:MAG TPA: glycoside hydrolase family 3 C-terminal domain-containing protein [Propionibacteriaceae bacterium]|nr:glycoside hydrolase family 3 C-terminal domain-containing protein [Propionibacteriaceae bacterium]